MQFAIEYYQGNWWYSYNGTWFGYLPGSVWSGGFVQSGLVQEFGEIAAGSTQPCTDMGNGALGTTPSRRRDRRWLLQRYDDRQPEQHRRRPTLYNSQVTSPNSFGYGGPGAC